MSIDLDHILKLARAAKSEDEVGVLDGSDTFRFHRAMSPDVAIALCEELQRYREIAFRAYDLWDNASKVDGDIRKTGLWNNLELALFEAGHTR